MNLRRIAIEGLARTVARSAIVPTSVFCLVSWTSVPAQEAVRMSEAREAAAEARQHAGSVPKFYNVKLGPTDWTFTSVFGVEYNDNADYRNKNTDADLILRPQISAKMLAPISDKNTLDFAIGAGYSKYIRRTDLDRVFVTPGSEISFNLFVTEAVINFHDRFSLREDTYQNPTLTARGNYSRLENIAGATAYWYLDKLIATLGYDHGNYISLNNLLKQSDGQSQTAFARITLSNHRARLIGVETGASLLDYNDIRVKDGAQYNAGIFYRAKLTDYVDVKAR